MAFGYSTTVLWMTHHGAKTVRADSPAFARLGNITLRDRDKRVTRCKHSPMLG